MARILNSKTGKPVNAKSIDDESAARRTADGWFIDRKPHNRHGWYGYGKDGKPEPKKEGADRKENLPVEPGSSPMPDKRAILIDFPGDPKQAPVTNVRWEFQTYAIARSGKDKGKIYGSISWGFSVAPLSQMASLPRSFLAAPSKQFKEAVALWDKQAAGPLKQRNDPNQVPLGPTITFPK